MGRGNFYPTTEHYRMRTYDLCDLFAAKWGESPGPDSELEWELLTEDLVESVRAYLPQSFQTPRGMIDHQWDDERPTHHNPYADSDGKVIAYNGHVAVALHFAGDDVHIYAFPVVDGGESRYDDTPNNLAVDYLHNRLPLHKVWEALPIPGRVLCGAWTSSTARDAFDENRAG